jgi:hypothetical protein
MPLFVCLFVIYCCLSKPVCGAVSSCFPVVVVTLRRTVVVLGGSLVCSSAQFIKRSCFSRFCLAGLSFRVPFEDEGRRPSMGVCRGRGGFVVTRTLSSFDFCSLLLTLSLSLHTHTHTRQGVLQMSTMKDTTPNDSSICSNETQSETCKGTDFPPFFLPSVDEWRVV